MDQNLSNYEDTNESQLYIETLCNEYIENHIRVQERDELINENNIEKRDIKGYHGREILELLQNADDAYQKSIDEGKIPDCELEVMIEFKNNILSISNTGTFFDRNGIKAIVQGNNSPKSGKYIGNKGTGFRSILNWADEIRIYSGEFNIQFSKEIANKLFEEIKSEEQIIKQLDKYPKLYIPILAVPQNIESCYKREMTSIEVVVNSSKTQDDFGVLKQIENIDLRILLFLPNVSKITIETDDEKIIYERIIDEGDFKSLTLFKYVDNEIQIKEQFYLFEKVIENAIEEDEMKKDIRLAIAVPVNFDEFEAGNMYTFFPLLGVDSPFNCVMHASYVLGDHRDTIISNEANKQIITEQLRFLVEVGEKFAFKQYADTTLQLLTPINFTSNNWRFSSGFHKFGLEKVYLNMLERASMLQTVNDEYISVKDTPVMFENDFPKFFLGEEFKTLLKPIKDVRAIALIRLLSSQLNQSLNVNGNQLLSSINNLANSWEIDYHVEVFCWWNQNYKENIPNLLKLQTGEWLNYGQECYLLVGDVSNKGVPSWVKVPSLDVEYQELLFRAAERSSEIEKVRENDKTTHISRLICQKNIYPVVDFSYRDSSNIITTVNSSVDSYNKSINFIKWLWSNYREKRGDKGEEWSPPKGAEQSPYRYNFPTVKGRVKASEKLYFGCAYGNDLTYKLFDKSYEEFPAPDVFGIRENEIESFVYFMLKFGIKKFPLIEKQKVVSPLDSYATAYEKLINKNGEIGSSSRVDIKYELPYIIHLEDKLKKLTTTEVVQWVYEDYSLKSYLSNPFYLENAEIKYQGNKQHQDRIYYGQIKNYLLFVFNEIQWIEIDGKRYAPKQIIKDFSSRNNRRFSDLVPMIDMRYLQDIAQRIGIDYTEVYNIFGLFDFCDKVTDLSSEYFYGLLLKLPEYDFHKSIDLSKSVYRIVEQANFAKTYEESDNKNRFFVEGKVLVQYKGKFQYFPSKKAYLPSSKIINKQNVPIMEKGQRTNNENFVRIFGCQQYNKEYSIVKESISEGKSNSDFQQYFGEFLKYAGAYSERNENFERDIRKLSVIIVDKIAISENDQVVEITDEYICIRESSTSWYITVFGSEYSINQISESIENICANIANTPGFESGKLGELFRARDKSDREFLIRKEFGSLDVISDESYKNEIKNNFIDTIHKKRKDYPIDEIDIDFDDFSSIHNSEKIIRILSDINTDIHQFRKDGFVYTINLISNYQIMLRNLISAEKTRYKNFLFNKAVKDERLQCNFLESVRSFENFEIDNYKNSIYFDVEEMVKGLFGDWHSEEMGNDRLLDSNVEYTNNYELLNPERLFEDEICNNTKVQQMIYFHKSKDFETWINKQKDIYQINTYGAEDPYSRFKDVIPQKAEPVYRDSHGTNTASKTKTSGAFNQNSSERRNRNKKVFGNKGELIIYNLLCEQFGKDSVFPKSEAFVEVGILKPGQASSGQYDLSYIDESGTEFFVEVKTGDGKSFIISPGELHFAKQNSNQFKLFLVYEIDSENPKYIELPRKFWEDKKFRKTEIIERIEFEF